MPVGYVCNATAEFFVIFLDNKVCDPDAREQQFLLTCRMFQQLRRVLAMLFLVCHN